eukprot:scaffold360030_cov83-Attheya_sp.AAC.1
MCRDFFVNSDSGSIGDPLPQQYIYGHMAPVFKVAGRSKYHKISLDYVESMSFRVSLTTLHHVRLSIHVLLYPGRFDA